MRTTLYLVFKILYIAIALFLLKHFLQAIIEWTDIIPVRPKAYIWGHTKRAKYVFGWQFMFTFWLYILSVIVCYLILRFSFLKKIYKWKLVVSLVVFIFAFLLYVHSFEFPIKKMYFPSSERFNYEFLEDFIIYSIVGYALISLTRSRLIKNYNKKKF